MRVLIDTTFVQRAPRSGTAVYLDRLIAALLALGPGAERDGDPSDARGADRGGAHGDAGDRWDPLEVVTAANPRRRPAGGGRRQSLANAAADLAWTQVELPRIARRTGARVIHHPLPAASGPPTGRAFGQVITVHDLAFAQLPHAFAPTYRTWATIAHRRAAHRADAIVAVSGCTAAEIEARWGIDAHRIVVAPHGPGQIDGPVARTPAPRHLLYVGDAEPRKDLPTLLRAYAAYRELAAGTPLGLVLAGPPSLADATGESPIPGVTIETDITESRLGQLHAGAAALVHPSRLEGFGLTILEAMRAGTPVIAAAIPAAVEVGADAVDYVPPGDAMALAARMRAVAAEPALRDALARRGIARADSYSWERSARAHLAAYSLAEVNGL